MAKESVTVDLPPNGALLPTEESESKRRLDPELRAIGAIIRILDEAKEEGGVSSSRIMRYLCDRFAHTPTPPFEASSNR